MCMEVLISGKGMKEGLPFWERNEGGASLLDFARAFGLWVANSSLPKKEEHLITCRSSDRKKRGMEDRPRIKSDSLTLANALEIEERLTTRGAWESRRDVDSMRETTASCIRETAKEVESKDDEEKRTNKEKYKLARKEAKLVVTAATSIFESLYSALEEKSGDRKLYRLAKARERKLLNDEGDKGFILEDLENSEKCRDYGYCRRIKVEEVKGAIHRIHRGRATGPDEILIPVDFWKSTGGAGLKWLTRLFDTIFRAVARLLRPFVRLVKQLKERKKDLYMVFINLEKAYNKVPKEILWRCLEAREVPVAYTRSIQDMYDDGKTRVRTARGDSKHLPVFTGLHQGRLLARFYLP
ncbi:uncharacterized protein LOC124887077 [Capsicum annuum]|uniref:uncharacterized protein LOC124887077 n=1 Tax=Capsicum annuum TaxID=4072 RepID=UPI001FB18243|nr:uncharacterized protein LOC124887077 [Capsicum annuum]